MILYGVENVKHDGQMYSKGEFYIVEDVAPFAGLIESGVLRSMDEANTIEEAQHIIAEEKRADAEAHGEVVDTSAQDTWGPRPDDAIENQKSDADKKAEEAELKKNAEEVKYLVLKDFDIKNRESKNFGSHAPGSIISANPLAAQPLVDNGTLELYVENAS